MILFAPAAGSFFVRIPAMELQLSHLHRHFDRLQQQYGCPDLDSIYGAGCIDKPDLCLIFMNPTGRNIAADHHWKGLKAPWLGTKNSWKLFQGIGILSQQTLAEIQSKKPADWYEDFAEKIYREIAANKAYVTNLGKCTQSDASPVSNTVFKQYLTLLKQEIDQIRPQTVITFGNQVSSLFLNQPVCVSQQRRTAIKKTINDRSYDVFPVFYPVGQGMRNLGTAIEDIRFIIEKRR